MRIKKHNDADGAEEGKRYVLGYMCGVDWQHEIGMAAGGNSVYASPEDCAKNEKCTDACGLVEVKVRFSRWVKPQDFDWDKNED